MNMERRLAAVLAADFAGFSALVEKDEEATIRAVRGHLDALELTVGLHRGRVVKTMGDGLLAEFGSAVDAVICAAAMQDRIAERNVGFAADRALLLRIGIHTGEILTEGGDIFGDGVNLAARVETLARPGGLVVTARTFEDVDGRCDLQFRNMGAQELKNIARPVTTFELVREGAAPRQVPAQPLPDKPSVAVLPLLNLSRDADMEYLADGLTEDIITALAHVPWLFVIARNSSFAYKGVAEDVRRIGRELGVAYVFQGSVRSQANRLRVSAQLVDAANGANLWADRYDGTTEDIFEVQDRITNAVAGAIGPGIQMAEIERAQHAHPGDMDAYRHYLRALAALNRAQVEEAAGHLDAAIALAPDYAKAMAIRSWCHTLQVAWRLGLTRDEDRERGIALARKALETGRRDMEVAAYAGYTLAFFGAEIERGMALVAEACETCPSFAWAWTSRAMLELLQGDRPRALEFGARAERLNPRDPLMFRTYIAMAGAHRDAGDFEKALDLSLRGLAMNPKVVVLYVNAIACLSELGRIEEARQFGKRLLSHSPGFSIASFALHWQLFRNSEQMEVNASALRRAGLPD